MTKGNGVLLFHISNRGVMDLLGAFNRGTASDGGIGDGLLMRDGYTMVFVGWEFDVQPHGFGSKRDIRALTTTCSESAPRWT